MAKIRYINTRFWSDNFVREHLNPLDRYLFLYFLTNEHTNICGIYEMPLSTMASETGLDKEMLVKMLVRLEGKVDYHDGWVIVINFAKYQRTGSKDYDIGVKRVMENEIPLKIRTYLKERGQSRDSLGTLPPQSDLLVPVPVPILKPVPVLEREQTPSEIARAFFERGQPYQEFLKRILGHVDTGTVGAEVEKFISYWTEPNKSGTKVRWELQPTFDVSRRLKTWLGRSNDYKNNHRKEILV